MDRLELQWAGGNRFGPARTALDRLGPLWTGKKQGLTQTALDRLEPQKSRIEILLYIHFSLWVSVCQISLCVSAEAFESGQLDVIIPCPEWRVQARPGYRVSDIAKDTETLTILFRFWQILAPR